MTDIIQPVMNDPNVKAVVLADINNAYGDRHTVFGLSIHRYILAEVNHW